MGYLNVLAGSVGCRPRHDAVMDSGRVGGGSSNRTGHRRGGDHAGTVSAAASPLTADEPVRVILEPPGRPAGHGTAPVPRRGGGAARADRPPARARARAGRAGGAMDRKVGAGQAKVHPVEWLDDTAGAEILTDLAPGAGPPADAAALANRLGGLPLALHHAGLALAADFAPESTFAGYLAALQDRFGPAHGPRPRRRTGHRDQHLGTVPGHPRRPRLPPG